MAALFRSQPSDKKKTWRISIESFILEFISYHTHLMSNQSTLQCIKLRVLVQNTGPGPAAFSIDCSLKELDPDSASKGMILSAAPGVGCIQPGANQEVTFTLLSKVSILNPLIVRRNEILRFVTSAAWSDSQINGIEPF